jgi:hypothetical protein
LREIIGGQSCKAAMSENEISYVEMSKHQSAMAKIIEISSHINDA